MEKLYVKSSIGPLEVSLTGKQLQQIKRVRALKKNLNESALGRKVSNYLSDYFKGKKLRFNTDFEMTGTEFQKKVWQHLRTIPYGKTESYAQVARAIGHPGAARAVGSACGKNPLLILVPCHRVVASNGELGGFALGLKAKRELLNLEQV